MKKAIAVSIAVLVISGISVRITNEQNPSGASVVLPDFAGVTDVLKTWSTGTTHFHTSLSPARLSVGPGPARAEAASASDWTAVRQSAAWANNNSNLADQIIVSLKNAGLLANSSNIQTTTVINGVTYKVKLQTGGSFGPYTTTVGTSPTFTNKFKLWRASDNLDALVLYFNNVDNPSSGVLLIYRLAVLSSTVSNNENLIVESYMSQASPSRRQTYSWGQAFWTSGAGAAQSSDRGRVILEEMTLSLKGGGTAPALCVRIAARTVSFTSGCGTGNHYYALAYGQKTGTNFETTAKSGVAVSTLATNGTQCGFNVLQYGIFNGQGFVQDNLTSSGVPSGYPDPGGSGYGVQGLFEKLNTVGAGAGGFDDTLQARIDGLAPAFVPAGDVPGF